MTRKKQDNRIEVALMVRIHQGPGTFGYRDQQLWGMTFPEPGPDEEIEFNGLTFKFDRHASGREVYVANRDTPPTIQLLESIDSAAGGFCHTEGSFAFYREKTPTGIEFLAGDGARTKEPQFILLDGTYVPASKAKELLS